MTDMDLSTAEGSSKTAAVTEMLAGDVLEGEAETGFGEARVRVRYAETDQMGVVYHANYLVWFEIGRAELLRQMGLDYKSMEIDEGALIAVVEVTARYKLPARYDDEIIIATHIVSVRGSVIRFGYKLRRAADEVLLCEGETVHIVVGRDMKRRQMPERYSAAFAALTGVDSAEI